MSQVTASMGWFGGSCAGHWDMCRQKPLLKEPPLALVINKSGKSALTIGLTYLYLKLSAKAIVRETTNRPASGIPNS